MNLFIELVPVGSIAGVPLQTANIKRFQKLEAYSRSAWEIDKDIRHERILRDCLDLSNFCTGYYLIRYQFGSSVVFRYFAYVENCGVIAQNSDIEALKAGINKLIEFFSGHNGRPSGAIVSSINQGRAAAGLPCLK